MSPDCREEIHCPTRRIEWITIGLVLATYLIWALATTWLYALNAPLAVIIAGIAIAQFSSLQHEVLHGHPFTNRRLNEALVFAGLTLTIPYGRFRDLHLKHHHDPDLTDPYDDPESNYLDPAVWAGVSAPLRWALLTNNTLLGRIVLGPLIGNAFFLASEARLMVHGDAGARRDWLLHLAGVAMVAAWIWAAPMTLWAYLAAVWIGQGLLKIRTFLEHRAHEAARARTVVVEDRGPLSILFLNNNFHAVHHCSPDVAWYDLPSLYAARRDHYLRLNEAYVYRSYAQIFGAFLVRRKDPVPHPMMPVMVPVEDTGVALLDSAGLA